MDSLANQFLIAMPALNDPNFERSVTLMCLHDNEGALGVVVNRPTSMNFGAVLDQLNLATSEPELNETEVYSGGPVETQLGVVLHETGPEWESTLRISDALSITLSVDVLSALAEGHGPRRWLMCLGYAGWGAGQLEDEMAQNAWLTVEADPEIIFSTESDKRWNAAANQLGVDLSLLSSDAGRA